MFPLSPLYQTRPPNQLIQSLRMHSPMKRNVLLAAALTVPFLSVTALVRAEEPCSAYPTGTAEKIESTDLEKTFGAVPATKNPVPFVYVTKTLINEFWQDLSAGIKSEAAKYNIKVDVQAPKDESSLVEQLNLAQTMLSQKPDALLLSPQSDSNMVPVVQAARKLNIPTIVIDDARTEGASTYVVTAKFAIGARPAKSCTNSIRMAPRLLRSKGKPVLPTRGSGFKGLP